MDDADPLIAAITGTAITPEHVDHVRRHLVMLRSLLDDVRGAVPALVPPPPGAWRSAAADGYADRLDDLRMHLGGATSALGDAEAALEHCLRRLERRLDVQLGAAREVP